MESLNLLGLKYNEGSRYLVCENFIKHYEEQSYVSTDKIPELKLNLKIFKIFERIDNKQSTKM
jgi:hypothetical protein